MKALVCVFAVCLALFETGCILDDFGNRYTEDFHSHYQLAPGGRISVENANGSIEIVGWDKDSIAISGTKSASSEEALKAIKIDVKEGPQSIAIRTVLPQGWHGSMGAKYVINLPRQTADVTLRTTNGSVHVGSIRGRLTVETSNGRIEGENLEGDCSFKTSNGSISIDRVRGAVEARTSNGTITLSLPADIKATVEAKTTHGTISSDFDELARNSRRRTHLDGAIGGGGPLIKLTTTNGSIRLRKT